MSDKETCLSAVYRTSNLKYGSHGRAHGSLCRVLGAAVQTAFTQEQPVQVEMATPGADYATIVNVIRVDSFTVTVTTVQPSTDDNTATSEEG